MTYIQLNFFFFLAGVFLVFYVCPVKFRWIVLLGASLLFYGAADTVFLPFLFVTSFSVYLAGRKMGHIYEKMEQDCAAEGMDRKAKKACKEQAKAACRKILILLLVLNLGILCYSKFTRFFLEPINALLAWMTGTGTFSAEMILIPLGISYYTFSSLSYLLDVYWKRVGYESNYFRFLLYACYFPHILQGPIARYGRLGKQLRAELRFDYQRVTFGLQRMLWGLIKKLVLADRIHIFITEVYRVHTEVDGAVFWVTMLLDVVYIYTDFSGCMDIAGGVSELFGIHLDPNFDHPFSSVSVTEFWRRWHMSMGGWFREYVYLPLSASKLVKTIGKKTRGRIPERLARVLVTLVPVSVTWVLTGLWHGTGKTYVAWGVYYAVLILLSICFGEELHQLAIRLGIRTETASWKLFQKVRTTLIFAGGRMLTVPGSLLTTRYVAARMVKDSHPWIFFDGTLYEYGLTALDMRIILFFTLLLGAVSFVQLRGVSVRTWIAEQGIVFRWGVYLLAFVTVLLLGIYGPGYDAATFAYMAY